MGFFNTIRTTVDNLRNLAQEYVETQVELLKVQAAEKISLLVSKIMAYMVLSFFLLFFLLFASIALAYVLSEWMGRPYAGFLTVAAIYLVLGVGIFRGRERLLRRPLLNAIVRELFREKTPKDNNGKQP
jgi:hypothetical protein